MHFLISRQNLRLSKKVIKNFIPYFWIAAPSTNFGWWSVAFFPPTKNCIWCDHPISSVTSSRIFIFCGCQRFLTSIEKKIEEFFGDQKSAKTLEENTARVVGPLLLWDLMALLTEIRPVLSMELSFLAPIIHRRERRKWRNQQSS